MYIWDENQAQHKRILYRNYCSNSVTQYRIFRMKSWFIVAFGFKIIKQYCPAQRAVSVSTFSNVKKINYSPITTNSGKKYFNNNQSINYNDT